MNRNLESKPRSLRLTVQSGILLTVIVIASGCGVNSMLLDEKSDFVDPDYGVEPMPLKTVRHRDCGVENYRSLAAPPCDRIYEKKRSKYCGVELYKKKPNKKCGGFRNNLGRDETKSLEEARAYVKRHRKGNKYPVVIPMRQSGGGGDNRWPDYTEYQLYYYIMKSCRRPEHGVELYKECESPKHEFKGHKECRDPSFGVESYNECELYLTSDEVTTYIQDKKFTVNLAIEHLYSAQTNFYVLNSLKQEALCTLKDAIENNLREQVVEDLQQKYAFSFGEEPEIASIDCSGEKVLIDTTTPIKKADLSDPVVFNLNNFRKNNRLLDVLNTNLDNIRAQMTTKTMLEVDAAKSAISEIEKIQSLINSTEAVSNKETSDGKVKNE